MLYKAECYTIYRNISYFVATETKLVLKVTLLTATGTLELRAMLQW